VLIGIDGSLNSRAVVNSVLSRAWPAKTEIRVVGAIHLAGAQARGRLSDTNALAAVDYAQVRTEICNSVHAACEAFDQAGFLASTIVRDGEPTLRLLSEADQWQADCIIVGAIGEDAHGLGKLGRVAATVAAKANCSVEVVRR
jgi:nucleotide-binding universal stress UspA family protein